MPRNKKPGFLHQLAILERPWQYITVDFKKCPITKAGYNMIAIFVDRLSKRLITILVKDMITAKELAPIFLLHIAQYISLLDSITSDQGPQFISDF